MNFPNADIFDAVSCTLVSSTTLLVYCYYGKMASYSFLGIAETLYECDWHTHQLKYQKYFVIAFSNGQKPMHFHGSHFMVLNLETFKDVRNLILSISKSIDLFRFKLQVLITVSRAYLMFKTLNNGWVEVAMNIRQKEVWFPLGFKMFFQISAPLEELKFKFISIYLLNDPLHDSLLFLWNVRNVCLEKNDIINWKVWHSRLSFISCYMFVFLT